MHATPTLKPVSVEMEPEGVFIHLLGDSETSSLWHLSNAERALTLCGLDVGYGNPRMAWVSTPQNRRCEVCMGQFGENSGQSLGNN
jgi:hypothetical protein